MLNSMVRNKKPFLVHIKWTNYGSYPNYFRINHPSYTPYLSDNEVVIKDGEILEVEKVQEYTIEEGGY